MIDKTFDPMIDTSNLGGNADIGPGSRIEILRTGPNGISERLLDFRLPEWVNPKEAIFWLTWGILARHNGTGRYSSLDELNRLTDEALKPADVASTEANSDL